MKKASIKKALYITAGQLLIAPAVLANSIKTDDLDKQDSALMGSTVMSGNTSLSNILSVLITSILGFLGIIFLFLTIAAGFKWMTANGNEEEVKKAKNSMKNAIIGLVIVIAAYAITYSVFKYLPFATTSGGTGGVIAG
jgi:small-conductance mechanosensitive channel